MFESDIERSKIRLLELVNSTQPTVYLNDILGRASIDYAYKQFFEAEFGWWLYEEQTLRQTNPNLDLHDADTVDILSNLDAQYRKHARFDREQLMLIIDSAVKSVLNYRVRPRTTLKWFVFRGEPTKPIYEVFLRMRYFADYRYLHEGFNQWLLKRGLRYDSLDIISVLEFERLIKRIDDDTILELSPSQFVDLIAPINYFFAELSADPTKQSIPIEAVIIFLDDKEIYIIAQKLELMLYQQGVRQLTKEMFLGVVDEVLNEIEGDGGTNEPLAEDGVANTSPIASNIETSPRVSTADLLRPTGTAESESILRTKSSFADTAHSPATESAGAARSTFAQSATHPVAPAVSVIAEMSRRPELATAPPTAPAPLNASSRDEQLAGMREAKDSSSLFVKDEAEDGSAQQSPRGFVVKDDTDDAHASSADDGTDHTTGSTARPVATTAAESVVVVAAPEEHIAEPVKNDAPAHHAPAEQEERTEHPEPTASTAPVHSALAELGQAVSQELHERAAHEQETGSANDASNELAEEDISSTVAAEASPSMKSAARAEASQTSGAENITAASELSSDSSQPILGIISRALGTQPDTLAGQHTQELSDDAVGYDADSRGTMHAAATQPTRSYPSINEMYDHRQRDNYIKRLCSKDEQRFDDMLAAIDQTRNWKEALAYLDRFYSQNNVDPQSSVARDFRMSVYKRFIVA